MAKKPHVNREDEEFAELMAALTEVGEQFYEKYVDDPNFEKEVLTLQSDESGKTIRISCPNGEGGSISFTEFKAVIDQIGQACLDCGGPLEPAFDPNSTPVLYLICDECGTTHKVMQDKLHMF